MNKNTIKIFVSAVVAVGILATIVVTVMNIQNGKAEKTNWVEIYAGVAYTRTVDDIPEPKRIDHVYICGKILIFRTHGKKFYALNPNGNTLRYSYFQLLGNNSNPIMDFRHEDDIFSIATTHKSQCGHNFVVTTTQARSITLKSTRDPFAVVIRDSNGLTVNSVPGKPTITAPILFDFRNPAQLIRPESDQSQLDFYVFHQRGSNTMVLKVDQCSGYEGPGTVCYQ